MKRPKLNEIPIPSQMFAPGTLSATISPGQWDYMLQGFYDVGATLLEIKIINGKERVVKAYKKLDSELEYIKDE